SGGMVLSGDDLTHIPPARLAMLKKLLPPTGMAARFDDATLRVGWIKLAKETRLCVFNWTDAPQSLTVKLPRRARVLDFWSGEELGTRGAVEFNAMPAHSARILTLV